MRIDLGAWMEELEKQWPALTMLSSRDSEILLGPGVAPGPLGAPSGAPFFLGTGRRHCLQPHSRLGPTKDDACAASGKTLHGTRQAMFMVDGERKIRLRNASGAELLARRDLLMDHHGMLACRDGDSERHFASALRHLITGSATASPAHERRSVWLRGSDRRGAAATMHILRDEAVLERRPGRVLVTVFESGAVPSIDSALLSMAYRLTSAEARLTALIAQGYGTAHCARELEVKTSTLRSHLSAIYRKTGANGKADLVRLALSMCAI